MEIPIYDDLQDLKENYIADFTNQTDFNFYNYLNQLDKKYYNVLSIEQKKLLLKVEELHEKEWEILEKLEPKIPSDAYLILFHDLWSDYCNAKDEEIFADPELFCDIIEFNWTSEEIVLINDFFKVKKMLKEQNAIIGELTVKSIKILRFINDEKKKIEDSIKQSQTILGIEVKPSETFEIPDNDYSGKNELKPKEKLIVLDKLGIIKFLTDKLNVSDNATHLAEILGAITGIDNQKGTLTGYCNYLIRPDHGNKNSPYFSETTERKAAKIYNTFNIKDKAD